MAEGWILPIELRRIKIEWACLRMKCKSPLDLHACDRREHYINYMSTISFPFPWFHPIDHMVGSIGSVCWSTSWGWTIASDCSESGGERSKICNSLCSVHSARNRCQSMSNVILWDTKIVLYHSSIRYHRNIDTIVSVRPEFAEWAWNQVSKVLSSKSNLYVDFVY